MPSICARGAGRRCRFGICIFTRFSGRAFFAASSHVGKSLAYGFVEYMDALDAARGMNGQKGRLVGEKRLKVS